MFYDKNYINIKKIKLLWITNQYDGPLSGVCIYKYRLCYFDMCIWGGYEPLVIDTDMYNKLHAFMKTSPNAFKFPAYENGFRDVCFHMKIDGTMENFYYDGEDDSFSMSIPRIHNLYKLSLKQFLLQSYIALQFRFNREKYYRLNTKYNVKNEFMESVNKDNFICKIGY